MLEHEINCNKVSQHTFQEKDTSLQLDLLAIFDAPKLHALKTQHPNLWQMGIAIFQHEEKFINRLIHKETHIDNGGIFEFIPIDLSIQHLQHFLEKMTLHSE